MELKVSNSKDFSKHKVSTFVVFVSQDDKDGKTLRFDTAQGPVDAKHIHSLAKDVHDSGKFKGAAKETVLFRNALGTGNESSDLKHLLLVGLGKSKSVNSQSIRVAGSVLAKTLSREKITRAAFSLKAASKFGKPAELGEELSEGALLGVYKFDELKSKKKSKDKDGKKADNTETAGEDKTKLWAIADDKSSSSAFEKAVAHGEILAEATNFARTLGNRPGNVCTPTHLADAAKDAAKGLNVKVTIWSKKEIEKHNMGCFLAVNQASGEDPRFIIMEYNGGKKSDAPFVMVGKGLTFDTGGISIKPSGSMEEMKFDMCGGAAVIGAMLAIARLKLKVNVVTLVPSTDNMPGGKAIKPGDIVTASNGKTVEINNTDAEGRLILSDALVYACSLKPKAIIDAATLTGACQVALGNVFTGVFTRDDKFMKKIDQAADRSGERVWRLPLTDDYVEDMKGTYGDLSNMAYTKGGGASHGAAFLEQFVDEGTIWAHFDVAATAWNAASRSALNPDKGATGVAVRMFTRLAELL